MALYIYYLQKQKLCNPKIPMNLYKTWFQLSGLMAKEYSLVDQ